MIGNSFMNVGNNKLRISSGQTEKDTHDIVLYFQREMEIKDDVILKVINLRMILMFDVYLCIIKVMMMMMLMVILL